MCSASVIDREVTVIDIHVDAELDDPRARLFFDHTSATGVRMLAVAEPRLQTHHGFLTAAAALAAFEEALQVAVRSGVESGLRRAFVAANDAVRAANRTTNAEQRTYVGITAAVLQDRRAVIGLVPPGQALLVQDGRLYGVPDLASWGREYMPPAGSESPEPLGSAVDVKPILKRTHAGPHDQIVLGASAVGRVLADRHAAPLADGGSDAVIQTIEDALADSNVEEAYAAWIRFDHAPGKTELDPARLAEIESAWNVKPGAPKQSFVSETYLSDPKMKRAVARDRLHGWIIEKSERVLPKRDAEELPLERRRRAVAPPGSPRLECYRAPRALCLSPDVRSRMPRGIRMRLSRLGVIATLLVLAVVMASFYGYDNHQARASKPDRYLDTSKNEIQAAAQSDTLALATPHLERARDALNSALANGDQPSVISSWWGELADVQDTFEGVARVHQVQRLGTLPVGVSLEHAQLIVTGGRVFLISNAVYEVSGTDLTLMPVLNSNERVGDLSVGTIATATLDNGQLVVSDGRALFRMNADGSWNGERLATADKPGGWSIDASGAFDGSFYVLEPGEKQLMKFPARHFMDDPNGWLHASSLDLFERTVDMAVDGKIYLLTSDGTMHVLSGGDEASELTFLPDAESATAVALYGNATSNYIYAFEVTDGHGNLIRYDRPSQSTALFQEPASDPYLDNSTARAAFAAAKEFAVDEAAGIVYFLTADGLWSASLG